MNRDRDLAEAVERSGPRFRLSLREYLGLVTIAMLMVGLTITAMRLQKSEALVAELRRENGYLAETPPGQIAAARAPSDQPLTYRVRIRSPIFFLEISCRLQFDLAETVDEPHWYGAVPVPPGESLVTVRIMEDPRDKRWKMATIVGSPQGTEANGDGVAARAC